MTITLADLFNLERHFYQVVWRQHEAHQVSIPNRYAGSRIIRALIQRQQVHPGERDDQFMKLEIQKHVTHIPIGHPLVVI